MCNHNVKLLYHLISSLFICETINPTIIIIIMFFFSINYYYLEFTFYKCICFLFFKISFGRLVLSTLFFFS